MSRPVAILFEARINVVEPKLTVVEPNLLNHCRRTETIDHRPLAPDCRRIEADPRPTEPIETKIILVEANPSNIHS